jgi:hypothetical protein
MMLLSRFSMNSAVAMRAAIRMARRCRSGSLSLRTLRHGSARLPADVSPRSLSYGCSSISRNGNKSVTPHCLNPDPATTTA